MTKPNYSRRRSRIQMGLIVFTCSTLCPAAATDAVALGSRADNDERQQRESSSDSLLERVHEAITDASRPLHPVRRERNTQSRWGPRLKKWRQSLASMLTSSSAVSHAVIVAPQEREDAVVKPAKQRQEKRPTTTRISDTGDMFDHEMHEGARLISASFGLVANTFGLIADGVRISGDTAAGFVGSSVRLMGTAVKSVSGSFESAGRALEPKDEMIERRKILTSERLRERQLGKGDVDFSHGGMVQNARSVASQSVRLVGSVIRGVGDIMLLAGEATETIASSTTGVAEDVVRIVEDFAGTLSSATSPNEREQKRVKAKVKLDSIRQKENDVGADTSYVTFGSYAAPSVASEEEPATPASEQWQKVHINGESLIDVIEFGTQEFLKLVVFLMADTQGVPSFAGELLGVIILCYLAALWIVSSSPAPHRREVVPDDRQDQIIHITHATGDEASELSDSTRGLQIDRIQGTKRRVKASCCSWLIAILFLPFRTFLFLLSMARRTIFNRLTLLLILYGGAWMYLCRASQLRSSAIQRNAEASGYRAAIDSIGSSSHSVAESVAWLNALMSQIWRVPYDPASEEGARWGHLSRDYPKFVRRSIRSNTYGRFECRSCDWDGGGQLFNTAVCHPYGGLEPYISGNIGTLLLDALGGARALRRKDVAYASLYSFTLGNKPPLLRSIEFLGASQDRSNLHFNVEVDALLEDLSLVLEVKLSSLEYALLPSTKVSVHAVDVTLPLKVSVSVRPDYPYVSTLELSLSEAPECNVRITPLSGESGLRGVDVGSLPLIREWVKDAIRETLSEYVTPKYIAIDIAAWLNSVPACQPTGIPTHSLADITQLRQKTRALVNPNPRTASPGGVSITSVAETLPSHRSAGGTAFVQDSKQTAFDSTSRKYFHSLIKPTTELSKRGMDRWIEKVREDEMTERNAENGLFGLLSRPLAVLSPFFVAIAATVFTDRLTKEKE